jgi:hypothetical protein
MNETANAVNINNPIKRVKATKRTQNEHWK